MWLPYLSLTKFLKGAFAVFNKELTTGYYIAESEDGFMQYGYERFEWNLRSLSVIGAHYPAGFPVFHSQWELDEHWDTQKFEVKSRKGSLLARGQRTMNKFLFETFNDSQVASAYEVPWKCTNVVPAQGTMYVPMILVKRLLTFQLEYLTFSLFLGHGEIKMVSKGEFKLQTWMSEKHDEFQLQVDSFGNLIRYFSVRHSIQYSLQAQDML